MDTKDLRIGNWLKNKKSGRRAQVLEVLTLSIVVPSDPTSGTKKNITAPMLSWEPIEMTSDILERKCGFKYSDSLECWTFKLDDGSIMFIEYDEHKRMFKMILRPYAYIHLPYVHTLQNVFYTHTEGVELQIKPL